MLLNLRLWLPGLGTHFKALPILFLFAFEKAFPQEGQQVLQLSLPEWEFALLFLFLFHSPK